MTETSTKFPLSAELLQSLIDSCNDYLADPSADNFAPVSDLWNEVLTAENQAVHDKLADAIVLHSTDPSDENTETANLVLGVIANSWQRGELSFTEYEYQQSLKDSPVAGSIWVAVKREIESSVANDQPPQIENVREDVEEAMFMAVWDV